mmetsp:Transcript_84209/g.188249  ORF Transcript_84209/g.188249 Transcript_84209/m.188249 type:complete len:266 (-) Transcript_84209:18-815(-)
MLTKAGSAASRNQVSRLWRRAQPDGSSSATCTTSPGSKLHTVGLLVDGEPACAITRGCCTTRKKRPRAASGCVCGLTRPTSLPTAMPPKSLRRSGAFSAPRTAPARAAAVGAGGLAAGVDALASGAFRGTGSSGLATAPFGPCASCNLTAAPPPVPASGASPSKLASRDAKSGKGRSSEAPGAASAQTSQHTSSALQGAPHLPQKPRRPPSKACQQASQKPAPSSETASQGWPHCSQKPVAAPAPSASCMAPPPALGPQSMLQAP